MDYVFYLLLALCLLSSILLIIGVDQYISFVLDGVGDISRILFKIVIGLTIYLTCFSLGILQAWK